MIAGFREMFLVRGAASEDGNEDWKKPAHGQEGHFSRIGVGWALAMVREAHPAQKRPMGEFRRGAVGA